MNTEPKFMRTAKVNVLERRGEPLKKDDVLYIRAFRPNNGSNKVIVCLENGDVIVDAINLIQAITFCLSGIPSCKEVRV